MRSAPPAWTVWLLVPLTLVSFFLVAIVWGGLAPALVPALRADARMVTLLGFYPIELIGVLAPVLIASKVSKTSLSDALPFKRVEAWRLVTVFLATVGLALVITYLQAWFARLTGLIYPREVAELIRARSPWDWLLLTTAVAITPAVAEELVTRGYIQSALVPRLGLWPGILLTAIIFALLHLMPSGVPTYVLLGLWLSGVRHRTGSLWGNMLAHATNNLLAVLQANFVPDSFWGPNVVWAMPLGLVMFAFFAFLSLRPGAMPAAEPEMTPLGR